MIFEDSKVLYRNFSGTVTDYNRNGIRSVDLIIDDPEIAQELSNDGWNVKSRAPREEGDEPTYYINVVLNYHGYSKPEVTLRLLDRFGKLVNCVELTERTVDKLDKMKIISVDADINPHHHNMGGGGIKGYINRLIVNAEQDRLTEKYADDVYSNAEEFDDGYED